MHRSFFADYLNRVKVYEQTLTYYKALNKRKVWIEPLFGEGKQWHGMRRFHLRRLWRVNCEALIRASGQNLKRLLKKRGWGWRPFPAEAMYAFFLATCVWLTPTALGYISVSSFIGSPCPLNNREQIHLTYEFCEGFFNRLTHFATWCSRGSGSNLADKPFVKANHNEQ